MKKKAKKPNLNPTKQAESLIKQATKALLAAAPLIEGVTDIELNAEGQSLVDQWAATSIVTKQMKGQLELDTTCLVGSIFPLLLEQWFSQKFPPNNPRLVAKKASCLFILKPTTLSVVLPKKIKTVVEALRLAGLTTQRAKMFAGYVRDEREEDFLSSLPELRRHQVDSIREAAESLYQAMQASEQWQKLLVKQSRFTVQDPDKFVTELPKKAKSSDEMRRVLSVIRPNVYPCQAVHTAPQAAVQARQLWEKQSQRAFFTPDSKYKILAQQNSIMVFFRSGSGWQYLGSSVRETSSEARVFAQVVATKPDALAEILAIFGV